MANRVNLFYAVCSRVLQMSPACWAKLDNGRRRYFMQTQVQTDAVSAGGWKHGEGGREGEDTATRDKNGEMN